MIIKHAWHVHQDISHHYHPPIPSLNAPNHNILFYLLLLSFGIYYLIQLIGSWNQWREKEIPVIDWQQMKNNNLNLQHNTSCIMTITAERFWMSLIWNIHSYIYIYIYIHIQQDLLVLKYGLLLVLNENVLIVETMPKIGKMWRSLWGSGYPIISIAFLIWRGNYDIFRH